MRKIGSLTSAAQAERFRRYLHSQGIDSRVDKEPGGCDIWVFEEEKVPASRDAFTEFSASPDAKRFDAPEIPVAPKPKPAPAVRPVDTGKGRAPLTWFLVAFSVLVTLATDFGDPPTPPLFGQFLMSNQLPDAPRGLPEIMHGEIWRLYTPMFLHLSPLHLLFNMYILVVLGGIIERLKGSWTLLWLILLIAPLSNLAQYFVAGANFGGMSGVIYGLFGFMWMRAIMLPGDGFFMPQTVVLQMIIWLFVCAFMFQGQVANGAHFGGLLAGMFMGALPRLWRTSPPRDYF